MRLDRILAQRGEYSRKLAGKMIRRKRVAVEGELCNNPKAHFPENASITIDGYELPSIVPIYVFHKPAGMLSTVDDPYARPCVGDLLPVHHHIVGRLDMDTRGLLLLSMDGQLTQMLLHPKRGVEREYLAWVEGNPSADLKDVLKKGVETSLGIAQANVLDISDNCIRLTVTEGRNRIVRRMLHNAGHSVLDLQRIRFGPILLGDIEESMMEALSEEQLKELSLFMKK